MQTYADKKNLNFWLTDDEFLSNAGFDSEEELNIFKTYCNHINMYLRSSPVPMIVYWKRRNRKFYFRIGRNFFIIPYNTDISLYDFQKLIRYWSFDFYPSYQAEVVLERDPTEVELASMAISTDNVESLIGKKISYTVIEKGMLEKVMIKDDEIILSIEREGNQFRQIRITKVPVSKFFLHTLKSISDDKERRDYIFNNSRPLNEIYAEKTIEIRYEGNQLLNFFRVWIPELHNQKFERVDDLTYRWSKFLIYFSNSEQPSKAYNMIQSYRTEYHNNKPSKKYLNKYFGIKSGVESDDKAKSNVISTERSDAEN